jgi:hypothetical protein
MEVWTDGEAVGEQVAEALAKVAALDNAVELSARVEASVATVAFQLSASDTETMAWPLTIAAAAFGCDQADGVIHEDDAGWMLPDGREVRFLR